MEWKFSKNKITEKDIKLVEKYFAVILPKTFKDIVIKHNGAKPSLSCFDMKNDKEKVFDSLISYQPNIENNVIDYYNTIKKQTTKNIIPFGEDPFGNLLCFLYEKNENPKVIFWNHEKENDNEINIIAANFDDFMRKLYKI